MCKDYSKLPLVFALSVETSFAVAVATAASMPYSQLPRLVFKVAGEDVFEAKDLLCLGCHRHERKYDVNVPSTFES